MKAILKLEDGRKIKVTVEESDFENKERTHDDGKKYYYVDIKNKVESVEEANGDFWEKGLLESGNFFNTKEEAEMESLRIEGMRVEQTEEKGNNFYVWDFEYGGAVSSNNFESYEMDKKFATEKECQNWYNKYGKAFEQANKQT